MDPSSTQTWQEQGRGELSSLATTLQRFNEAFNRFDASAVASFWREDGTLISPIGTFGEGRAGIERVFQSDAATILQGTTSRFTITRERRITPDCVLLDCDHDLENCRMPDGSRGSMKIHLVLLASRSGDQWRWLDARPYRFADRPPALH
jgi:uncharacterized protein (TIGR02246 family)